MVPSRKILRRVMVVAAAASTLLVSCSSGSGAAKPGLSPGARSSTSAPALSTRYPNSVVVLGHSGTTGANSDPDQQGSDARQNSWATGDNPEVDSIYQRLLAVNPAVRGHNSNFGIDGSTVNNLEAELVQALAVKPLPDLFMIQEVDNDMQCDGTDPQNYPKFGATLTNALQEIVAAAPKARILLVSGPPGTVDNFGQVVANLPEGKSKNQGDGPCDMFDLDGKAVPAHWRYQEKVIQGYQAQLKSVCAQFTQCRYDGGALYRMTITAEDLAVDAQHLSISGHRKQAALEWAVLGY
jgi:lysophospholipase L1-like esterase